MDFKLPANGRCPRCQGFVLESRFERHPTRPEALKYYDCPTCGQVKVSVYDLRAPQPRDRRGQMDASKIKAAIAVVPCGGGRLALRGRTVGECLPPDVLDAVVAAAAGASTGPGDAPRQAKPGED